MASFIQPVRPIDTAPPWNWNPAETFQTAFTLAQENKRAQEKHAAEMELEQILLPYKQKQAALALDKMQFDVELQSTRIDREREFTKQAYRQEIDRMKGLGGGQTDNSTGSGYQSKFGFGRSITPASAATGTTAAPRVIGSGVQPKGT
jgi:hypothetical protein